VQGQERHRCRRASQSTTTRADVAAAHVARPHAHRRPDADGQEDQAEHHPSGSGFHARRRPMAATISVATPSAGHGEHEVGVLVKDLG